MPVYVNEQQTILEVLVGEQMSKAEFMEILQSAVQLPYIPIVTNLLLFSYQLGESVKKFIYFKVSVERIVIWCVYLPSHNSITNVWDQINH